MSESPAGAGAAPDVSACLPHFGLRAWPFSSDTGPRQTWLTTAHAPAATALAAAIRGGQGFAVLTGDAGIGKTFVLEHVLRTLEAESAVVVGRIPRSLFEPAELPLLVAESLGLAGDVSSPASFATRFHQFLAETRAQARTTVVAIDDAHHLADEVLHKLFDLSMIGRFEEQPLAVVLVGQRELDANLDKDEHAALRGRIALRVALDSLPLADVAEYVHLRLRECGAERALFDRDAIEQIVRVARGAPGIVNVVCQQALLLGCQRGARTIGADIVLDCLGTVAGARRPGQPEVEGGPPASALPTSRDAVTSPPDAGVTDPIRLVPAPRPLRSARRPSRAGALVAAAFALGAAAAVVYGYYSRVPPGVPGTAVGTEAPRAGRGVGEAALSAVGSSTDAQPAVTAGPAVDAAQFSGGAGAGPSEGRASEAGRGRTELASRKRGPSEPQGEPLGARAQPGGGERDSPRRAASAPQPRSTPDGGGAVPATGPPPRPRAAPPASAAPRPRGEPSRASDRDAGPAGDPGAVIDWLLKESGRR